MSDTTDTPTLADELRWIAGSDLGSATADRCIAAADVLDALAPEVIALVERTLADVGSHPLPDGWTAMVWSHSGVMVKHDTYPHGRSSIYVGCIGADDYAWSIQLSDHDRWTTAATLADVVTAYLAAGR